MPPIRPLLAKSRPLTRALSINASTSSSSTSSSSVKSSTPLLLSSSSSTPTKRQQQPAVVQSSSSSLSSSSARFSTSSIRRATDHEDHYDAPGGWLFGVPPGEKYENEGWEPAWIYGFWGSLIAGAVAYSFKPDTSIQTWALEEARRRLEAEGILEDPFPNGVPVAEGEEKSA